MSEDDADEPTPPDLPDYVTEPLSRQSPERLESVATYAIELAEWKRQQRQRELDTRRQTEAVDDDELKALEGRELSTDPDDYDAVPSSGAYITVKETKPGYQYYYWQWREDDTWKNEYIAPVDPKEE